MKKCVPGWVMMEYGPRFFSESFLEGRVDLKYLALTKTWSPTVKSGAGVRLASAGP
jgi:hypothetical protein